MKCRIRGILRDRGSGRGTPNLGSLGDIPRGTEMEAGPRAGARDPVVLIGKGE